MTFGRILLALAICLLCRRDAFCANPRTITWYNTTGDGKWETPANWNLPGIPSSSSYNFVFANGQPCTVSTYEVGRNFTISGANDALNIMANGGNVNAAAPATSFLNNGQVNINPTGAAAQTYLALGNAGSPDAVTISGSGVINLNGPSSSSVSAELLIAADVTLASPQLIRGRGNILVQYGSFTSNSNIIADVPGESIEIGTWGFPFRNNSVIKAINGANIKMGAIALDQRGGGLLLADGPGSIVHLGGGASNSGPYIIGGTIRSINGGLVQAHATANDDYGVEGSIIDAQVEGYLNVSGGSLTNNGHIHGTVFLQSDTTFNGTGDIEGINQPYKDLIRTVNPCSLVNGPSHLIHGSGLVSLGRPSGQISNNGIIRADDAGGTINLSAVTSIQNNNRLEATNGGTISFGGVTSIQNNNRLEATNGGTLDQIGNLTQSANGIVSADGAGSRINIGQLDGGQIIAQNGGKIQIGTPNNVVLTGNVGVGGIGIGVINNTILTNAITVGIDTRLDGSGRIELNNNWFISQRTFINGSDHTIEGPGTIYANQPITNDGTFAAILGELDLTGIINFSYSSILQAVIGGNSQSGSFGFFKKTDTHPVILNGTLSVKLTNGYTPDATDLYTAFTGPTPLAGRFLNVASGGRVNSADGTGSFQVDYGGTQVVLSHFGPPLVPSKPVNISTRASVQAGDGVTIAGIIITGNNPKQVLIRGLGPSLQAFGINNYLVDPVIELHDAHGIIGQNDQWKSTQQSEIEATGFAPANDAEAALIATLGPGNYTVIFHGVNSNVGVGLIEVYDLEPDSGSSLLNISTRGFVGTGDNVLIGGLAVGTAGSSSSTIVVRAIGPTLQQFGITGALQDPVLELHDASGAIIATNDNWRDTQSGRLVAAGYAPPDNRESAIIAELAAGNYTAIVRGAGNSTGIALVEAYGVN